MKISARTGNIYTGSLYLGLISLIENQPSLVGKKIAMFSYGSGLASSMFILYREDQFINLRVLTVNQVQCFAYGASEWTDGKTG